jgi:DNA-directed RNA polymerase
VEQAFKALKNDLAVLPIYHQFDRRIEAGREIIMARYTHPEKDLQLILDQLKLTLPEQSPPRITGPKDDGLSRQGESSL